MKNWLILKEGYLQLSPEELNGLNKRTAIFPCGHCSGEHGEVHHNVIGIHRHLTPAEKTILKGSDSEPV